MKVIHLNEADRYEPQPNWERTSLCAESDISIEHFVKPAGHASPRHDHPNAQVLVVLQGQLAILDADDVEHTVNKGDPIYIPGNESHIVKNPLDTPSIGLDIFVPGRSFDFWLKRKKG